MYFNDELFERFMHTYNGRQLAEKYGDLSVAGTWRVVGEDSNCDMGATITNRTCSPLKVNY
jgi:hypothetical protein